MSNQILENSWDQLDQAAVEAFQGASLHHYLRDHVIPFSRYYSQLFKERGWTADDFTTLKDLQKLPFLEKKDILASHKNPNRGLDFVLIPDPKVLQRRSSVILRALWYGMSKVKDELDREYRPTFLTSTTGRSTEPVAFLYTQHDLKILGIAGGRIIDINNRTREDRVLNMFPYAPHLAYWMLHQGCQHHNLFCLGTGGGKAMGTDGNLKLIQKIKPTILAGMPTFIYHVLNQAVEEGEQLKGIQAIVLGGEKSTEGTRLKLMEYLERVGSPNVQIVSTYGFTESKMAFTECGFPANHESPGYHLFPDLGIIEIIDPETGQVVAPKTGGEIVFTSLQARGTAVLRYRTGDRIENGMTYEPCPYCGRQSPRLLGKISRVSDIRAMQFQKVKGTLIDFNELELSLDNVPSLDTWQVELRKKNDDPFEVDEIVIHAHVSNPQTQENVKDAILKEFNRSFEVHPNAILFESAAQIRQLQQVGVALKELKIIDKRTAADAKPALKN